MRWIIAENGKGNAKRGVEEIYGGEIEGYRVILEPREALSVSPLMRTCKYRMHTVF